MGLITFLKRLFSSREGAPHAQAHQRLRYEVDTVRIESKMASSAPDSQQLRRERAVQRTIREALSERRMSEEELRNRVTDADGLRGADMLGGMVVGLIEAGEVTRSRRGLYYLRGHKYGGTLTLISRRGTIDSMQHRCDECGDEGKRFYSYAESSLGRRVYICSLCWGEVKDRSFGPIDVIEIPTTVSNAFEQGS